MTESTRKRISG